MLEVIKENWPLKLLSLVIAVILWFYVLGSEDPQTTQAVTVPVKVINEPEDLEVISITPETVELRLRGRQSAFESADLGRIRMEANLRGVKVGKNEVTMRLVGVPMALTVLPGYPSAATVQLDKIIRRERPVHAIPRGDPASGFVIESVTVKPDTVTVIGAASVVQRVTRCVAVVDTSGFTSTVQLEAGVEARDHRDVVVHGVSFEPPQVGVIVKVRKVNVKTVPVRPVLGNPPTGWRVVAVNTQPLVVTVTGEEGLGRVEWVSTIPLDISGLRGSKTYSVPLNVPSGLSVLGPASVEVTVTTRAGTPTRGSRGGGATVEEPESSPPPPAEEDVGGDVGNSQDNEGDVPPAEPTPSEPGGLQEPSTTEETTAVTAPAPEGSGP